MRGCGSWPVVFIIPALIFVSAVHSANVTAPGCKTKFNSTLRITVISDPHRVRRADKPLGGNPGSVAPICKAGFNSTVQITEISNGLPVNGSVPKVGHIRQADKPPGAKSPDGQWPGGQSPGGQSPVRNRQEHKYQEHNRQVQNRQEHNRRVDNRQMDNRQSNNG